MITKYQWTVEDFDRYFCGVFGYYQKAVVEIRSPYFDDPDDGNDENGDPNWGAEVLEANVLFHTGNRKGTKVAGVPLKDIRLTKPPGITVNLQDVGAGYIRYQHVPYKKGVNSQEYKLFSPTVTAIYNYLPEFVSNHFADKLQTISDKEILTQVLVRKRSFDLSAIEETLAGQRLGCILNNNYYLATDAMGVMLFFKQRPIGKISIPDRVLEVKTIKPTMKRLAEKCNLQIKVS